MRPMILKTYVIIILIAAKFDNIKNKLLKCSQDQPLKYEGQFQCLIYHFYRTHRHKWIEWRGDDITKIR